MSSSMLRLSAPPELKGLEPETFLQTNSAMADYIQLQHSFFDYAFVCCNIHWNNNNMFTSIIMPDKENAHQVGNDYVYCFHFGYQVDVLLYVNTEDPRLVKQNSNVWTNITGYMYAKDTEILLYENAITASTSLPFKANDLRRYKKLRCESYCFTGQMYTVKEIPIQKIVDMIENDPEYFTKCDTTGGVISNKHFNVMLSSWHSYHSFYMKFYTEDYSSYKKGDIELTKDEPGETKIKIYGVL